ncbi:MAG TPA: HAD family hydrolase [Syntrophobacteraceae bacterium]|nr:HAD family hydrolase [Syntrophobacteraceae bacterium]
MLKAVIFDFDGVLADSEPLHYQAFQKVLVPLGLGHSYERYLEHFIGFDDRDAFREIFGEANRPLDAATLASLIESKSAAFKTIVAKGVRPFPGAASLVADLIRNEVPLAIASGALKDEIRLVLTALRLGSAFSIIVGADDVQRSKPDPESYLLAFQRLAKVHDKSNLNRRDCVVIEDTPAGVQAAKSAGLFCVAVTHTSSVEGLASADHVVKSLEGLNYEVLVGVLGRWKA